jgi:hypothetical protein
MAKRKVFGTCHLCGTNGELSYEHVPPEKAYNNYPLVAKAMDKLWGSVDSAKVKGTLFRRGAGAYTLCHACNNNTGSWYGADYIWWVKQGMEILTLTSHAPSLNYNFLIYPLRVIKQIACMFFSVNSSEWGRKHSYLERLILSRKLRNIPDEFKIYAFYAVGRAARQSNLSGLVNIFDSRKSSTFSELAFPPFGYVLAYDNPPHPDMLDITYFARYDYDDCKRLTLKLPVLPIISYFPGDYRSQAEIDSAIEANRRGTQKE